MFQAVKHMISGAVEVAPPKDVKAFNLAANVDAEAGGIYYFDGGELKRCVSQGSGTSNRHGEIPAVVIIEDEDGRAGGITARGYYITPGMVFKAKPAKADSTAVGDPRERDNNFKEGVMNARFSDNGKYVDWETDPAGFCPMTVLGVVEGDNDDDSYVYVTFHKTLFCGSWTTPT